MGMGGAITVVAATTTVGTAATTMAGGIIAIGGDFQTSSQKERSSREWRHWPPLPIKNCQAYSAAIGCPVQP
jgi:hypothetical protein